MNLLRLPFRLRFPAPTAPRRRPSRRRAVRAILSFAAFVLLLNVGFALYLDYGPPRLRDPEYGKRSANLHARLAENPGRPLVLVIGSSRAAMGVRPSVLEADGDPRRPLLFNLSLAGSGPVMELMVVRRMLAEGIKPAAVLIEYWPAFLREDGPYWEQARIDLNRLRPVDRQLVREYFQDPDGSERVMRDARLNPWHAHRFSLVNQFAASWQPLHRRSDAMFTPIDDWGWLPGRELRVPPEKRKSGLAAAGGYYKPLFEAYQVSPVADRAFRQAVEECRVAGAAVGLVYLPEATEFRALMPKWAAKQAEDHVAKLRADLDLPLIDARHWSPDEDLPDGFHLCQPGAAEFTKKLAPAVAETFTWSR